MHAANIVYGFNGEFYSLIDARIKAAMRIWSKARFDIYRWRATERYSLFPPRVCIIHFASVPGSKRSLCFAHLVARISILFYRAHPAKSNKIYTLISREACRVWIQPAAILAILPRFANRANSNRALQSSLPLSLSPSFTLPLQLLDLDSIFLLRCSPLTCYC